MDAPLKIRLNYAKNRNIENSEIYISLFNDQDVSVRAAIAKNESACKFKEYETLFDEKDILVKKNIAANPKAIKFDKFKDLFKEYSYDVKESLAKNPSAVDFDQFFNLIQDPRTCYFALENPRIGDFDLVKNIQDIDSHLYRHSFDFLKTYDIRKLKDCRKLFEFSSFDKKLVVNPYAAELPEFKKFFDKDSLFILRESAKNPNAPIHKEYTKLIELNDWKINRSIVNNPNAQDLDICNKLIPKSLGSGTEILENPEATQYDEFKSMMTHEYPSFRERCASNENAPQLVEYKALFSDKDYNVRAASALNHNAAKLDEYRVLIKDKSLTVKYAVAQNPNAVRFPEFKDLFKNPNRKLLRLLCNNPNINQIEIPQRKSKISHYEYYKFEHILMHIKKLPAEIDKCIDELKKIIKTSISECQIRYFCLKCNRFHSRGKIYEQHAKLLDLNSFIKNNSILSKIQFKNRHRPKSDKRIDPDKLRKFIDVEFAAVKEKSWFMKCPKCMKKIEGSSYLKRTFKDDPILYWTACSVTHYRHNHISYYDKTWKYSKYGSYNPHYNSYYHEDFKEKVNERVKRNLIRSMIDSDFPEEIMYIFIHKMLALKNTEYETRALVEKHLEELMNPFDKEIISSMFDS